MINLYIKFRTRRIEKLYNINNFTLVPTNPLPPLIIIIGMLFFLHFLWQYTHYISDFLYWFVEILKLKKVLKLKFLHKKIYYEYVANGIYFYLAFSLFLDMMRLCFNYIFCEFFISEDVIFIHKFRILEHQLKSINFRNNPLNISFKSGLIQKILGLERIIIQKNGAEDIKSPYVFNLPKKRLMNLMQT